MMNHTEKGILSSTRNRGVTGWILAMVLIGFYVLLYWAPELDRVIVSQKVSQFDSEMKTLPAGSEEYKNLARQKSLTIRSIQHRYYVKGLEEKYKPLVNQYKDGFTLNSVITTMSQPLNPMARGFCSMRNVFRGQPKDCSKEKASRWLLYGFLYTLFVTVLGIRFMRKWKNNPYQRMRTVSVIGFQVLIAFILPELIAYGKGDKPFYLSYFWPLKPEYFFPSELKQMPTALALWATAMAFVAVPVLTYFFGKRWYCSWVCGCGALAETAGDDFRHLSSKSSLSWRIEQVSIHSVLVIIVVITALLFVASGSDKNGGFYQGMMEVKTWYMFFISMGFAGVIGTGFYPLAGSRVWCRFGCPQAAILGLIQVLFSRFRITTNGDQCMSCGNCSTYCEMGIDVRQYAMTGQDIVRASCVGCGMCASVCPRGVLKLETGPRSKKLG